jgi:hypothetical protein
MHICTCTTCEHTHANPCHCEDVVCSWVMQVSIYMSYIYICTAMYVNISCRLGHHYVSYPVQIDNTSCYMRSCVHAFWHMAREDCSLQVTYICLHVNFYMCHVYPRKVCYVYTLARPLCLYARDLHVYHDAVEPKHTRHCKHAWGSHSTSLTQRVFCQESSKQSDDVTAWGCFPGHERASVSVSCLLLQTAACGCACAGICVCVCFEQWELLLSVRHSVRALTKEYLHSSIHVQVCIMEICTHTMHTIII